MPLPNSQKFTVTHPLFCKQNMQNNMKIISRYMISNVICQS